MRAAFLLLITLILSYNSLFNFNMKLLQSFIAFVAADPQVLDCNAGTGGAAAMSMTIAKADVQQAPGAGWSLDGDVYSKTVAASTTNTAMDNSNNLVMTQTVNSGGCEKVKIDDIEVCKAIGHVITFTCSYPMKDQILKNDADFTVSGSDTKKTASGTGTLDYKLTVDTTAYDIGSKVTATITPVTSGLVHATIESCSVTHKGNNQSVKLIDDGMQRECTLGVDITGGQGTGNLGFFWSSFKWSTALNGAASSADEDQEVSCHISLSKDAPTTETKNDCSAKAPVETPVKVTWTKTAGQWCTDGKLSTHPNITLDECKTKCTSDPLKKCEFINYTEATNNCYLMSAEHCALNNRATQVTYDIYQAVE